MLRDIGIEKEEVRKLIPIHFKNKLDFRARIAALWQDQKDDECYDFTFGDEEAKQDFVALMNCFYRIKEGEVVTVRAGGEK